MESRFSYDFSNVRIHTDEAAAKSAYSVNALAYTLGNDIVFGEGQYQPNALVGRRLLAHELTHVVQQLSADRNIAGQLNRKRRGLSSISQPMTGSRGLAGILQRRQARPQRDPNAGGTCRQTTLGR
jgi:Domain of unknown function (DUF4157)